MTAPQRATGPPPVRVFSVDEDCAQLDWADLPAGLLRVEAVDTPGVAPVATEIASGPGTLEVAGLPSATRLELRVRLGDLLDVRLPVRTLAPLPGARLARIATVGDVHIGSRGFDLHARIADDDPADPHPQRCVRAAFAAISAWGVDAIVVKGDVTEDNQPAQWAEAGRLLQGAPVLPHVLAGNHDGYFPDGHADPDAAARAAGFELVRGVQSHDVGGATLVLVDTTIAGKGRGRVAHVRADAADAVHDATHGALLLQHHNVMPALLPYPWPIGIPSTEGLPYLRDLARAQPRTLVSSGHTHRTRRRAHRVLTLTEVGSVKDYPGVWAGYTIHEGGIRQVVRRVPTAPVLAWTERTGDALHGVWRLWSPGTLGDRCFDVDWRRRR